MSELVNDLTGLGENPVFDSGHAMQDIATHIPVAPQPGNLLDDSPLLDPEFIHASGESIHAFREPVKALRKTVYSLGKTEGNSINAGGEFVDPPIGAALLLANLSDPDAEFLQRLGQQFLNGTVHRVGNEPSHHSSNFGHHTWRVKGLRRHRYFRQPPL